MPWDVASGLVKVRIPFYGDYNETDPVKIAEEGWQP
jgi:signal recognition particle GTPase